MPIEGYNTKLKKKEPITGAVINKNGNRYMAKGKGSDGTNVSVIMNQVNAEKAIKAKEAKKGEGWEA